MTSSIGLTKKRLRVLEEKVRMIDLKVFELAGLGGVSSIDPAPSCQLEEENMIIETHKTYEMERRALRDAVHSSCHEKDKELRKHFNIDCDQPKSAKEIVVAIQNGKFKYHDEGKHSEIPNWYCSPFHGICFCDPEKSEDYVGYHTAHEKMEDDKDAIILKVNVLEPDKALTHVEEFKKRKYH